MPNVPRETPPRSFPWLALLGALLLPFLANSCSSTPKIEGIPQNLPDIALNGSSATPAHHLTNYEYPFDANGKYMDAWAAEGERRAGRSPTATSDDEEKWSKSHKGHVTASSKKSGGTSKSGKKSSGSGNKSSSSKKKSSSKGDDDKPKSKSKSGTKSSSSSSKKSSSGSGTKKKKKSDD